METSQSSVVVEEDVRVQKLSHVVADRLRAQIISGQRKAGEKLPLESELLAQFKVSRPTIREALRILEVESLILLGRGARTGATILGPTVERAAEYAAMVLAGAGTTISELHEARALIEPPIVAQLARKRDRKYLEQLQSLVDQGLQCVSEGNFGGASECLGAFHGVLMSGADNRAVVLMVEMLRTMQQITRTAEELADTPEGAPLRTQIQKALQAYQELVDLMRSGRGEEAQMHWRKYMERAQAFLQKTGLGERKIRHR